MKGLLIVLASVALLLATFALWVRRDLLDTDAWTETSAELIADEEVRAAVADFLVDRIDANVNREIARRLDKDLRAKAREALADPGVRRSWAEANREAHAGIVALVDDTSDEPAVLNLHPVLEEITAALGIGPALAARLPDKVGRLTVLRHDQLEWAQNAARILKDIAYWLIALALLLYAAAIWVARGARREAVGLCALGLVLIGAVVLLLRWLGGAIFDAALDDTVHAEGATGSIWSISTSALATEALYLLAFGGLVLILTLALGRWLRSSETDAPHYEWDEEDYPEETDEAEDGEYATER
jgi:hypothetical protein